MCYYLKVIRKYKEDVLIPFVEAEEAYDRATRVKRIPKENIEVIADDEFSQEYLDTLEGTNHYDCIRALGAE